MLSLSKSIFVVRFDYSSLCRFLFFALVIYNKFKHVSAREPLLKYFMKSWLDYSSLCRFLFFALVIYNKFKNVSAREPILKYFMKSWRSKSFVRSMTLVSCIIHILRVVSVSSNDGTLIFWYVPVLHVIHLCRDRKLW